MPDQDFTNAEKLPPYIFAQINNRINDVLAEQPEMANDVEVQKKAVPYLGEVMLGHVRYGTFGKNSVESVHPFLRQNNWMHRNVILAGNFNMTNSKQLLEELVELLWPMANIFILVL